MRYIKRPEIVEATVWRKHGDHPEVMGPPIGIGPTGNTQYQWSCSCGRNQEDHGFVGIYIACPGDYVVTDEAGKISIMCPRLFKRLFLKIAKKNRGYSWSQRVFGR